MKRISLILILVFFAFLIPSREIAFAEGGIDWTEYYPQGVPICTKGRDQKNIRMVPDGSGGTIIVWEDYRGGEADIYAQKIDENGVPQWTADGVPVCTNTNSQLNPVLISDGSKGAIIAWEDYSSSISNIYAVRISSAGTTYLSGIWMDNGKALSPGPYNQSLPDIVSNGSDGAIIVWQEDNGSQYSIYARGIDGGGNDMWAGSVAVSAGTRYKKNPKVIRSDSNNVIVTWQDYRNNNDYDIYAQQIDIVSAAPNWYVNGSTVAVANGDQLEPQIVPDGSGGAIITWTDCRNDSGDIYAQRIDSNGYPAPGWTIDGIPICQGTERQYKPFIINALSGGTTKGAIIAWEDMRNYSDYGIDIYAIRISSYPPSFGPGDEKLMAGWLGDQVDPRMVNDNQEGGIISWREKDLISEEYKIFASKRNQNGEPVWINPQVQVCQALNIIEHQMVSDNSGGVIIAWVAQGTAGDYNIYAQRVISDAAQSASPSICGIVLKFTDLISVIEKVIQTIKGITGVEVEALKDNKLVSSDITFNGYYELTGLKSGPSYEVRATWSANDIVTSVSIESKAPSDWLWFVLEVEYILGEIGGIVNGVENKYIAGLSSLKSKRMSGSGLQKMLSPGKGIAFVELEQRGKVIARVPLETDGSYSIPNLLPGKFIARAYNGTIYSKPRTVNLKEGETLKVNFAFGIMPGETVFNYPNPAKSGSTTIRYYCGYSDPEAEIKIYNINGELVREVKDSEIDKTRASENIYSFLWDCENSSGKDVASGVYIYIVEVKEKSNGEAKKVVKRMAIIR